MKPGRTTVDCPQPFVRTSTADFEVRRPAVNGWGGVVKHEANLLRQANGYILIEVAPSQVQYLFG